MSNYPCANSTCKNLVNKAGAYCSDCKQREREATPWIAKIVRDAEKERRERKIQQDNKHRKDDDQ